MLKVVREPTWDEDEEARSYLVHDPPLPPLPDSLMPTLRAIKRHITPTIIRGGSKFPHNQWVVRVWFVSKRVYWTIMEMTPPVQRFTMDTLDFHNAIYRVSSRIFFLGAHR